MHLEKLELQGFKSFVAKTVLEFPGVNKGSRRGITAVVGPNGSGKSNLADAVRWAMGEQSLKLLRSKKTEDVIFSGTDKRARVGLAEVSLYLNNEDRRAPIDYSQVVITRRLYRSGESEYLLNGNRVRLQDINLLLAQASFGQKTYSIIGQGMVDIILSMSPLERKEFFDEAAGTRHLQIKKEESLRKLDQAEDNLRQGEALIQEIAPRLRSLVRQVRRLERRDQVAAELRVLREQYYGSLLYEADIEIKRVKKLLDEVSGRRSRLDTELKEMEKQFTAMEKAVPSSQRFEELTDNHRQRWEAKQAIRDKLLDLRAQLARRTAPQQKGKFFALSELAPEIAELESSVSMLETIATDSSGVVNTDSLKKVLRALREHLGTFKKYILGEEINVDHERLNCEIEAVRQQEEALDKELNVLQEEMRKFQQAEDEKNRAFFALERSLQGKRQEATALLNEENEYRVTMARLNATQESLLEASREELGEAPHLSNGDKPLILSADEKERHKREIDVLKARVAEIGSIDPETAREYEETQGRYDFLTKQSDDLKQGIKDLREIIQDLESTIASQFSESFQRVARDFEHYFKILFKGGHAKLARVNYETDTVDEDADEESPADEDSEKADKNERRSTERIGIEIQATPPGKRLKGINMLSGGERALTSLALICAIISNNPAPFVVLDEVDAALDEANSARLAEIIDQLSHRSQFIVVTHNRAVMHEANMLYGVTMGDDGTSKILSLKLEEIKKN